MKARITIMPRAGVRDPEGRAIARALTRMGYGGVEEVRRGKELELVFKSGEEAKIRAEIEEMCRVFLANPLIEDWEIEFLGQD